MPTFLSELLTQVKAVWARLDAGQRLLMGALVGITVIGLAALVYYAGRPDWQLVLQPSDPREMSSAVNALSRAGIPFERDVGGGILVPRASLGEAKGTLFQAGVAVGGGDVGVAEPDGALAQMAMDRSARKDLLDAKNRSRARAALLQLDGVLAATVTANKPARSAFAADDDDVQPRAGVVLQLRAGTSFRRTAAAAVDIASAALGISPKQVVVRDAVTFERYSLEIEDGTAGMGTGDFLAMERDRGHRLSEVAQSLLDSTHPGGTRVRVTVELDPAWELRKEKIVAETPLVLSEKSTKNDSSDSSSFITGDPTVSAAAVNASGPRQSRKESTTDRTYEPFTGTREVGRLAPDVRKISVALVVDEKLQLTAEQRAALEEMVKRSVGFDEQRDAFTSYVATLPDQPEVVAEPEGPGMFDRLAAWLPMIGQVLAVGLVLLFLRSLLAKARPESSAAAAAAAAEETIDESQLTPEESIKRMRRDIERAIQDDPSTVSRMLERWLTEVEA